MKFKKISLLASTLVVAMSLTGCMGGRTKLPEGDVKVVTQQAEGVVELLLESADYGNEESTVATFVLPKDSKYELTLTMEQYIDGKLIDTKEIKKYETDTIEKDTPVYFVANASKVDESNNGKTIFTFTEIDQQKTEDKKTPKYKYTKAYEEAINYDKKVQVEPIGTDLDKEMPLIGYIEFKDDDKEKKAINLNNYKEEVANYSSAHIVTIKATKK